MTSRRVWIGFAILCLVSGTSWIIPPKLIPANGILPTLEQQALLFGLAAVAALCFRLRLHPPRLHSLRLYSLTHSLQLAAAGLGFFGVPIAIVEIAHSSVGATTRVAAFAIVPVVVILAIVTSDHPGGSRRLLAPALLGLGGLLLLLPLQFSSSIRGQSMLALIAVAVLTAGLCSVWMFHLLQGTALAAAVLTLGAANAVFLLVCAAARGELVWGRAALSSILSLSALIDAVSITAIVWLLREMPPVRFAARYLLIPWVTIVESLCLARPAMTLRMAVGTVLLTAGAAMVLLLKDVDPDSALSLR